MNLVMEMLLKFTERYFPVFGKVGRLQAIDHRSRIKVLIERAVWNDLRFLAKSVILGKLNRFLCYVHSQQIVSS